MKIYLRITTVFFLLAFTLVCFSQTGSMTLQNGELVYINPPAYTEGYYDKVKSFTIPINTPIKITYSNFTANRMVIYTSNTVSTPYVNVSSIVSGATVTVTSPDGYVYVKSSYLGSYFSFMDETFTLLSLTYAPDNTFTVNDYLYARNNMIVKGKLGVGIENPTQKVEFVDGSALGKFSFSGTGCTTTSYEVAQTIDNTGYKINVGSSGRNYKIAIAGTDRFKLLANENIGIGNSSLNGLTTGSNNIAMGMSPLSTNSTGSGNVALGYAALGFNTTGSNNIALGYNAGRTIAAGSTNTTANNSIYIGDNTKSALAGQTNEIVIGSNAVGSGNNTVTLGSTSITKTILNGNVGIGTIDPKQTLTIDTKKSASNAGVPATTGTNQNGILRLQVNGDSWGEVMDFGMNVSPTYAWIQPTNRNNLGVNYDLSLNPNGGNVGISTTTPKAKLDVGAFINTGVIGTVFGRLAEGNTTGDGTFLGVVGYETQPLNAKGFAIEHHFWGQTNSSINFFRGSGATGGFITFNTDNNNERMRINSNGNVSIGLTVPDPTDAKLSVNGVIHAKEITVDITGLADFVFHPTYNLMPLTQVEQYVKTNSHLPEMPSAAEVSKNGMNMGEMQNKLLQKVEELTLYIIEQQKRIEEQGTQITELKAALKK